MGRETAISWTDHTFNPWWGCTKVSPGCDNCYAEALDRRWFPILKGQETSSAEHWGKDAPRRVFGVKHWNEPMMWDEMARQDGKRKLVFCASMADVMDDEAPEQQRERLWNLIDSTPNLIWQLLTKRPHRFLRYLPPFFVHRNVWLGMTAENEHFYRVRFDYLKTAANYYGLPCFVSYEPAIGPLTLGYYSSVQPDWIICGGESGANRREFNQKWAEDLLLECRKRGVAFFMKQMSAQTPELGKALIPPQLKVQQFPRCYTR